jgi:hypothetical protein
LSVNRNAPPQDARESESVSGFLSAPGRAWIVSERVFRLTALQRAWQHTRAKSIAMGGNRLLFFRKEQTGHGQE